MKRNNAAKRFGLASLSLILAISTFGGFTPFAKSVAFAEETTTVQAEKLVDMATSNATTITQNDNGLSIDSNAAYSATFARVFNGDTTFNFRFADDIDTAIYGDLNFRITDVTDANNYFDIKYYVSKSHASKDSNYTGVYVQYKDEIRMAIASSDSKAYNTIIKDNSTISFLPHFLNYGKRNDRLGVLMLTWSASGVLTVKANTATTSSPMTMRTVAKFDGTYNEDALNNGFSGEQEGDCGLPKLNFPNGYTVTVSSDFEQTGVQDHSSGVSFTSIINSKTYNLTTTTQFTKDNYMKAYDILKTKPKETGKVLLGWQDAESKLYSNASALTSGTIDLQTCKPYYLGFDTVNGASVRIDSSGIADSGIRFQTLFNLEQYTALSAAGVIDSFGTLIAWTDTLKRGDFTIENYQSVIDAGTAATVAQVKNENGTFIHTDQSGTYTAYSMALIKIQDYTKKYSARGYLVVKYADGSTQTLYTDYDVKVNSRSIAEVAYNLKTEGAAEYNKYTGQQKTIVDTFAAAYVVPAA